MNFKETLRFLPHIWKTNLVPCLLSPTGLGKTELFRQVAQANNMDLIVIHVAHLEVADFVGLPHINEDNKTANSSPNWLPYKAWDVKEHDKYKEIEATVSSPKELEEVLKKLVPPSGQGYINPNGGIIFLDEVNRGQEDMRQAMYQFLQEGRIHTWQKPDNYKLAIRVLKVTKWQNSTQR
jgi:MoxR-like ATPase